MILPDKHITIERSLIGIGSLLLEQLENPRTITGLWDRVHRNPQVGSFERFVITLDLLYAIGAVELADGLIRKTNE
jgi:hypothetical protein